MYVSTPEKHLSKAIDNNIDNRYRQYFSKAIETKKKKTTTHLIILFIKEQNPDKLDLFQKEAI